jgi:dihydroorotate dehydrogenase electron transfer subunit
MTACEATVRRREEVAPGHHLIELDCREVAAAARPGQFVHVRVGGTSDPLLRRPFSIMLRDERHGRLEILVRAVGRGTEMLAGVVEGNRLDLLGPLGNGFDFPEGEFRPLLVAGGVGVAPLIFAADALQTSPANLYVRGVFGAATEDALVCWQEFTERLEACELATEDGSAGTRGRVTDLLPEQLDRGDVDVVYTCGPRPMMAVVARLCAKRRIPCWVSMEQFMGCGIGACLGCVIPTRTPGRRTGRGRSAAEPEEITHLRVCADGPVFDARTIAWEELTGI